jgi:hypothetical protein
MRLPKGTSLRQTALFEPLSVSVRLTVRAGPEPKEREKINIRKSTFDLKFHLCVGRLRTTDRYHFCRGPSLQELADVIKCTKFCGDRLRGFCAMEGQSLGSPIGKRYGPYHSGKHYRAAVLIM